MTSLHGLKVIDLSRVLGGPFCTQLLADHGATVIKVEPPQGDETRGWGPPFKQDASSYFIGVNRNKLGMALDLTQPQAKDVLLDMLADADVLVENFKPGTMERWGLGFEQTLSKRFPRLIHCRVSGFGATGPLGSMPGYDAVVQAMSGLMSVNGEKGAQPLRMGVPVIDIVTGMNAVIAILLAVHARESSGRGQFVEATLYDSGVSLMHPHLPNFHLSGKSAARSGNAHPNICPYDMFSTATVPIFLAIGNDRQFATFADIIGDAALANDPRFLTNALRLEHSQALRAAIEQRIEDVEGVVLAETLMQAGVPCGAVVDTAAVAAHPHTRHRDMVVEIGDYVGTGSPVKLSETAARYRTPPPMFAEHARQILEGMRYDENRIALLLATGAVPTAMRGA